MIHTEYNNLDVEEDISIKTIELVLGMMVKENKVTKIGSYKDARYMRKMIGEFLLLMKFINRNLRS